jgi:3-oxoacyl-[acyl-carrier protein] reductase
MTTLSGKTALVTGASRGIGRASALVLVKAGAQVLVHYGRGSKEAEAVVADIRKAGGRADAVAADLAAPDGPHRLAKQVRAIIGDRLDILVANAGISKAATIDDYTVEDFDNLFAVLSYMREQHRAAVLARGPCRCRHAVGLRRNEGRHRHTGETLRFRARGPRRSRQCRRARPCPDRYVKFTKTDADRNYTLGMQALKRLAQPDDIGGVVTFLASDEARWITGDTIHVDGGSKL